VLNSLDIALTVYAATANDKYRKPRVGMWEEMVDDHDINVHGVDLNASFLIGDAAGRDGDHSDSDRFVRSSKPILLNWSVLRFSFYMQCTIYCGDHIFFEMPSRSG
jgi:histidinol phosphatase-like enzyme